jgi:hypothetical protein
MTSAHIAVRPLCCRGACPAATEHPDHHDRLLTVDTCVDAVTELFEIAVTWRELDWSGSAVVGPQHWPGFAAAHDWVDAERAERVFSLAADIVGRDLAGPPPQASSAVVIELVRS